MSTNAGIEFTADKRTVNTIRRNIEDLNAIVNDAGLGISCTPRVYKEGKDTWTISGQTHWDYDGDNGERLVFEIKKWAEWNKYPIEVVDEWYV